MIYLLNFVTTSTCTFFIFFVFKGAVAGIQKGEFPDDNQPLKCYTLCIMKTMRTVRTKKSNYITIQYAYLIITIFTISSILKTGGSKIGNICFNNN